MVKLVTDFGPYTFLLVDRWKFLRNFGPYGCYGNAVKRVLDHNTHDCLLLLHIFPSFLTGNRPALIKNKHHPKSIRLEWLYQVWGLGGEDVDTGL
jgi:hypothetical protein